MKCEEVEKLEEEFALSGMVALYQRFRPLFASWREMHESLKVISSYEDGAIMKFGTEIARKMKIEAAETIEEIR